MGASADADKPADGTVSGSLLEALRARDSGAWERLVTLYTPLVEFWVRRSGVRGEDIADVRQEVFRSVSVAIESFRRDRPGDTFRGWLRVITRSRLADHGRRCVAEPPGVGGSTALGQLHKFAAPDEGDAAPASPEEAELIRDVRLRALGMIREEFEPKTWQMFWRVVVDEHPVATVAADLGVTPSAVRLAKSRVLRRLRAELGEIEGE